MFWFIRYYFEILDLCIVWKNILIKLFLNYNIIFKMLKYDSFGKLYVSCCISVRYV